MPEPDMEQKLAPMLAALRERIAKNDLAPIREGPRWLVYRNEDGERLCANDVLFGGCRMIEMEVIVRVQPENRMFWSHTFYAPQVLAGEYDSVVAADLESGIRYERTKPRRADAPA